MQLGRGRGRRRGGCGGGEVGSIACGSSPAAESLAPPNAVLWLLRALGAHCQLATRPRRGQVGLEGRGGLWGAHGGGAANRHRQEKHAGRCCRAWQLRGHDWVTAARHDVVKARKAADGQHWGCCRCGLTQHSTAAAFRAFTPRAVPCRHSSHPLQPTNIARPTFALCSSLPREPGSMASFFDFSEFDFAAATAYRGAERG